MLRPNVANSCLLVLLLTRHLCKMATASKETQETLHAVGGGACGGSQEIEDVGVVVIGTGPSGLLTSALLQGRDAFLNNIPEDVEPELRRRLKKTMRGRKRPIALRDLDWPSLADQLKGRTNSPACTLIDLLHMPGAEIGMEIPPAIEIKKDLGTRVEHVIVGPPPGGMWREIPGEWTTLSPGFWMALPGLSVREFQSKYPQSDANLFNTRDRMPRRAFLSYLQAYAEHMGIMERFVEGVAKSVQRDEEDAAWIVDVESDNGVHRRFRAASVVLATGSYSSVNKLHIPGEQFPFVYHRSSTKRHFGHRVLVVGAGLSAGDFLVDVLAHGDAIVHHSFRSPVQKTKIGSKFLDAGGFYSDYGNLAAMMFGRQTSPRYIPEPETDLIAIQEDGTCLLRAKSGREHVAKVDTVYILVGSQPNLKFIKGGELHHSAAQPRTDNLTNGSPNPHPIFVDVDMATTEVSEPGHEGVYALGPLRGANFVRFLVGDAFVAAWSIRSRLAEAKNAAKQLGGGTQT